MDLLFQGASRFANLVLMAALVAVLACVIKVALGAAYPQMFEQAHQGYQLHVELMKVKVVARDVFPVQRTALAFVA